MASGNGNQKKTGMNLRPQSGSNPRPWSSGMRQEPNSYNSMNDTNNNQRGQRHGRTTHNPYDYQQRSNRFSTSPPTARDDETRAYAVNLQLKPVEWGITAKMVNGIKILKV